MLLTSSFTSLSQTCPLNFHRVPVTYSNSPLGWLSGTSVLTYPKGNTLFPNMLILYLSHLSKQQVHLPREPWCWPWFLSRLQISRAILQHILSVHHQNVSPSSLLFSTYTANTQDRIPLTLPWVVSIASWPSPYCYSTPLAMCPPDRGQNGLWTS